MPDDKPKTEAGKDRKVGSVMKEFKQRRLHSGSKDGPPIIHVARLMIRP